MERLTIPDVRVDEHTTRRAFIDTGAVREHAMEFYCRLKAYEDTLLSPDEIVKIGTEAKAGCVKAIARMYAIDINRLRELAGADREGRAVVLPKQGSTVYYIGGAFEPHVIAGVLIDSGLERLKATVMPAARDYLVEVPVSSLFTSREEAKRRLKG